MSLIFDNVHKSSSKVDQKECVYAERRRYGEGGMGGEGGGVDGVKGWGGEVCMRRVWMV